MPNRPPQLLATAIFAILVPALGWTAWNPSAGDWSKTVDSDLRIMTWNLNSRITPGANTDEGLYAWDSVTRIVADMRPDVWLIQEGGDSTSQSELAALLESFIHGGAGIETYVQRWAPDYDLPYIYVSPTTDGYNRNVILSRFPFADLNGDGVSQSGDIFYVASHLYAPGGNGGLRGFMFTELDLPDFTYSGDLVVGNAHLKAFGGQSEHDQRITAARNVAYFVDYFYNGGGFGVPDPHDKVFDMPAATDILDSFTPVVLGGDWNEDETKSMQQYGEKGPASWLTQAELAGSNDGVDRDRSDSTYDNALEPRTGDRTTQSGSKLDYLTWQDSIATLRRAFIFNSSKLDAEPSWYPPAVAQAAFPGAVSGLASDHRPVIVDLMVPLANLPDYTVTVNVSGQGDVLLDPAGGVYAQYTPLQLTPVPDPGWYFIEWQGDLTGWDEPANLVVESDLVITAVFDTSPVPEYDVTVNVVGNGQVTLDPPTGPYRDQTLVTVAADPDSRWYLDRWEGDLGGSTSPQSLLMDSHKSVTAVFEELYPCGDANCDTLVNFGDIDVFVLAITYPAQYLYDYPGCDNADTNGDGEINFGDIDPFVAALTGEPCD